jgi:hypothetical protein
VRKERGTFAAPLVDNQLSAGTAKTKLDLPGLLMEADHPEVISSKTKAGNPIQQLSYGIGNAEAS